MRTKNITFILILSFFISSFYPCKAMDDTNEPNSSMTTVINNNIMSARNWMHNFYKTYQRFGIIATITSSFNMYDFKRITGLDRNKLTTYNQKELDNAIARINKMIKYKGVSAKLVQFLNEIDDARLDIERGETNPENIPYTEEEALKLIQEEKSTKKQP